MDEVDENLRGNCVGLQAVFFVPSEDIAWSLAPQGGKEGDPHRAVYARRNERMAFKEALRNRGE